jgi:hypothetical protein
MADAPEKVEINGGRGDNSAKNRGFKGNSMYDLQNALYL